HHLRIAEIFRALSDGDWNAERAQPFHIGAFGRVGALHAIAKIAHHFGDAAHADTADADEVDRADRKRHTHGIAPARQRAHDRVPSARCSARSASRAAASAWPSALAAAARALSISGCDRISPSI